MPLEILRGLKLYEGDKRLAGQIENCLEAWEKAFPGIDIAREIAKAHAWEVSNPARRKRNRIRFLYNWLSRAFEHRRRRPALSLREERLHFQKRQNEKESAQDQEQREIVLPALREFNRAWFRINAYLVAKKLTKQAAGEALKKLCAKYEGKIPEHIRTRAHNKACLLILEGHGERKGGAARNAKREESGVQTAEK